MPANLGAVDDHAGGAARQIAEAKDETMEIRADTTSIRCSQRHRYSNGPCCYMMSSWVGCPSSLATLQMGVEQLLKDAVPEVRDVVAID